LLLKSILLFAAHLSIGGIDMKTQPRQSPEDWYRNHLKNYYEILKDVKDPEAKASLAELEQIFAGRSKAQHAIPAGTVLN
jgi:hypothetical protein